MYLCRFAPLQTDAGQFQLKIKVEILHQNGVQDGCQPFPMIQKTETMPKNTKRETEPIGDLGELITIEEWLSIVKNVFFTDHHGWGEFSDGEVIFTDEIACRSRAFDKPIPKEFTHVVWYNK